MIILRALSGATLSILIAGSAFASPAVVLTDSAMRQAPGSKEPIVRPLPAGTHVLLDHCTIDDWCLIERRGKSGWIQIDRLDLYPGRDGVATPEQAASADSNIATKAATVGDSGGSSSGSGGGKQRPIGSNSTGPNTKDPIFQLTGGAMAAPTTGSSQGSMSVVDNNPSSSTKPASDAGKGRLP